MMTKFKIFHYSVLIKEHHLDTFAHVNNATYLTLLEEARWDFLTKNQFGLEVIKSLGIGPVILECHIKFLKELTVRQSITIESQVVSYEGKIGTMRQDIFNENRDLCAEAKLTFGFFDI